MWNLIKNVLFSVIIIAVFHFIYVFFRGRSTGTDNCSYHNMSEYHSAKYKQALEQIMNNKKTEPNNTENMENPENKENTPTTDNLFLNETEKEKMDRELSQIIYDYTPNEII